MHDNELITENGSILKYLFNVVKSSIDYFFYFLFYKMFYIIILAITLIFIYKLYSMFKEKFDEVYLFNLESMSEEERKLFIYTRKMTNINEKSDQKPDLQANKGNIITV